VQIKNVNSGHAPMARPLHRRGRGRCRALSLPDRVLLRVPACRTNLTMQQLAALFGISDSAVHRGTTGRRRTSPNCPDRRRRTGANRGSPTAP
jgi:hypothetical protein